MVHTMCTGHTIENGNSASNKDWQKVCIFAEAQKYRHNAGMFELNIHNTRQISGYKTSLNLLYQYLGKKIIFTI